MANSLNVELAGKHVVISAEYLKPEFSEAAKRVFLCEGGFGCNSFTHGHHVHGKFVADGEECGMSSWDIERFATEEEIAAAKKLWEEMKK
jgi:hypothetical protein